MLPGGLEIQKQTTATLREPDGRLVGQGSVHSLSDIPYFAGTEGTEQPKRSILIEGATPGIEPSADIKPQLESKLI